MTKLLVDLKSRKIRDVRYILALAGAMVQFLENC